MKLSAQQRKALYGALLDTFPNYQALTRFANLELDINLDEIAGRGPLNEVLPRLIEWSETSGRCEELITGAASVVPKNQALQDVYAQFLPKPFLSGASDVQTVLDLLPVVDDRLFGRERELELLNQTLEDEKVGILILYGFGGIGKTALIRSWLRTLPGKAGRDGGGCAFVGCSFFSQGTRERAGTSDQFFFDALKSQGDLDPGKGSLWIRARRLAELLRRKSSIIVLDGLEPLQSAATQEELEGGIKDVGIREFLSQLAQDHGRAFCVVTTRLKINDPLLNRASVVQRQLEVLESAAAQELLRQRGLTGPGTKFKEAVEYLNRHPLALVLAAEYSNTFCSSRVECIKSIPLLSAATRSGRHAKSVMAAYEVALERDNDILELEILQLMGLFDRPANWEWFRVLLFPPTMPGFKAIGLQTEEKLKSALERLGRWGLLSNNAPAASIDSHPLVREFFADKFRTSNPAGWRVANQTLYTFFKVHSPQFPQTVPEMEPLLLAIVYGCQSGNYTDALRAIYRARVMREDKAFALVTLGLIGPVLSALTYFFTSGDWGKPKARSIDCPEGLIENDQLFVLSQVAYCVAALKGYAAKELTQVFALWPMLSASDIDSKIKFQLQYCIWRHYSAKSMLNESLAEGRKLLELSSTVGIPAFKTAALRSMSTSLYRLGLFGDSLEYAVGGLQTVMKTDDPCLMEALFGDDPSVNCRCLASLCLWHLGKSEESGDHHKLAIDAAERISNPHGRAVAYYLAAYLYDFQRNFVASRKIAEKMIEVSLEYGFKWWLGAGLVRRGWSLLMAESTDDGIGICHEGLALWRATGSVIGVPYWNALIAEGLGKLGRLSEALNYIDEGIALLTASGELWWEPELYRMRGEMMLLQGASDEAVEKYFERAVKSSAARGDQFLHLRSSVALGSFLIHSERMQDAKKLLVDATEGFPAHSSWVELISAREMLGSLGP